MIKQYFEIKFEKSKINNNIFYNKEKKDQNLNLNIPPLSNYDSISLNDSKIEENSIFKDIEFFPKFPPLINNFNDTKIIDKQTNSNSNLEKEKRIKLDRNNTINFSKDIQEAPLILTEERKIENLKKDLVPLCNIKLRRKRKNDNSIRQHKHTKFSEDNILRKCKNIILKCALDFINERIKIIYNGNIGKGVNIKQLVDLNWAEKSHNSINYYKNILTKTLGEIFSENITPRYWFIFPDSNRNLIKRLLNEQDENKKNYFQKLFNITFIKCLKQFRGTDNFEELKGFRTFEQESNKYLNEPEYIEHMKTFLLYCETKFQNKKRRQQKKMKENN